MKVLDKAIDEIIANQVFHVTLTGGEPFLARRQLYHALERLIGSGIACGVNTNLVSFQEKDALRLFEIGIRGILTSVCSFDEKTHDNIVQKHGSFQRTIAGIATALRNGISISASMVLTKLNVHSVYQTGIFLRELGVTQFFATKASPPINSIDFQKLMITQNELIESMDALSQLQSVGLEVGILECYPLCGYLSQKSYPFATNRRCSAGITTCTIGVDGDVRPCSHSDRIYGNIEMESLKSTWMAMSECRNGSDLPDKCISCALFNKCSGGCRVDARYCFGVGGQRDPYSNPDDVALVEIFSSKNLPMITKDTCLGVVPIKMRREKSGVLCANINKSATPVFCNQDTAKLIELVKVGSFSPKSISESFGIPLEGTLEICSLLIRDGIFEYR